MLSNGPVMKLCMPLMTRFAPELIHPCPYQGRKVGVENLPIDLSLLPVVQLRNFPKGEYRTVKLFFSLLNIVN